MSKKATSKSTVVTISDEQLNSLADIVSSKIEAKLNAREKFVDQCLSELQAENALLKEKTDDLEQRNRLENLRIFGIKEEAKEDTNKLVLDVAMKIGIYSLEKHHISRSHRVGKKHSDKPRAIIVKFVSYADRQKLFEAKKKLKGSNISIREDLTSIRQAILRKAHEKFEEVWTQNGVIVIKDGAKFHRIRTMEKLDELINSDE
ncbi:LINE-1 type transposase domain-containing protein 1 [Frankliniella fusca]|uniref:LINE-1 type transposase domain-containing protein 1 n=1 Tax=Frankliniella fusca TaxID=407009 RepID=A0AAE1I4X8_9NEOP|nr:LINE-1 type transposase domain-containing protein 1 [Frankliniella fusca]